MLSDDERAFLVEHLPAELKRVQLEVHRTRNLSFREQVTHDKDLLEQILRKLEQAPISDAAIGGFA
jgi:hypothetical protein